MADLHTQIARELEQILLIAADLTGLPSRWNGRLELVDAAEFKGKKSFSCDIQIDAGLAARSIRWPTLIHEALHALSIGYLPEDYQRFRGWEEGVVEQLQRLIRPTVLEKLGVIIPEEQFLMNQATHPYNVYIGALEEVRLALASENGAADEQEFYSSLLAIPLKERPGHVLALGYQRATLPRAPFIRAFSAANAVLTRRPL